MAKSKRRSLVCSVILCSLAGGLFLIIGRGFVPVASGQSYPNNDCAASGNPCPTCPQNANAWDCQILLNGWNWGDCTTPAGTGCTQSSSACGQKTDCQFPPNPLPGNQCQAVFNTCS